MNYNIKNTHTFGDCDFVFLFENVSDFDACNGLALPPPLNLFLTLPKRSVRDCLFF